MRKTCTLLSILILFFASSSAQAPRTLLYEQSTSGQCLNCPYSNQIVDPVLMSHYQKVVSVKYQSPIPGGDVMYFQNRPEVNTRLHFYKITQAPVAVVDGDTNITYNHHYFNGYPGLVTDSLINAIHAQTTPITMRASYAYDSATDSVHTTIVIKNVSSAAFTASASGQLRLMVALEEMDIHFTVPPGDNGEKDFYYVFRKFYPDTNGTVLPNSLAAGDSLVYTFAMQPPAYVYSKKQMAIAAWVQDFGTAQVHQAAWGAAFNALSDVQLADSTHYPAAGLACNKTFTPTLALRNLGTTRVTSATVGYSIAGNSPVTQAWTGSLDSGQRTIVTFPIATIPGNCNDSASYFIENINNGALIDMNGDNSNPTSPFLVSVNSSAVVDTLSETFETALHGRALTYTTPNYVMTNKWGGFIATDSAWTNFAYNPFDMYDYQLPGYYFIDSIPSGGYAQSRSSFCFTLYLYNYLGFNSAGLIFDPVNRTGYTSGNLTFQHAYDYCNSYTYLDTLSVLVSTDCGQTWDTAWVRSGAALATHNYVLGTYVGTVFISNDSVWRTDTVDMSAYNGLDNVVVQFQVKQKLGMPGETTLYLDNVNWVGVNPTADIKNVSAIWASVYPNPAASTLVVQVPDYIPGNTIVLYNLAGQQVMREMLTGTNTSITVASLANGLYLYRVMDAANTVLVSGKLAIEN